MTKGQMMKEYKIDHFPPGLFSSIEIEYHMHDKTCSSIPHMWLGHKGGFSCFNEQVPCDGCKVTFYWEGLHQGPDIIDEDGDEIEAYYCDCCLRKLKDE